MGESVKVKDILYYARIIPTVGIFDVCQLIVLAAEANNKKKISKETFYEEY